MTTFSDSKLPLPSQPWGREVTKAVTSLESKVESERVNNTARDNQLNSSIIANQAATIKAQSAANDAAAAASDAAAAAASVTAVVNNIYSPGTTELNGAKVQTGTLSASKITAGTLNASLVNVTNLNATNINSGTLTGVTVQTGSSGQRVVMGGTQLNFYDGGGSLGATMSASSSALLISNGGNGVNVNTTGSHMTGGSTGVWCGDYGSGTNVLKLVSTSTENTGTLFSTGGISTAGGLVRTAYIAGGTTGASFNNDGNLIRTPSSARYKQDISDIEFDYEAVMALQPKVFRLKEEAEVSEDAIFYPGFIAEEIAGTALDIFVSYQRMPDGTKRPDGVRYAELTAALLSAIKHQDGLVNSLTARIEALESKV